MTALKQIYKCNVCGNIIEVLHPGEGELVCCGQSMEPQMEKYEDQGSEKHVPVIKDIEGGYEVVVGSVIHPMEKEHYIEWIELWLDDNFYERKMLSPGMEPRARFDLSYKPEKVRAREYCNVHGLWEK